VILRRGKTNKSAKKFYNFMLSKEAKDILQRFGYKTV
jgi:accessory colonization factor AcfC